MKYAWVDEYLMDKRGVTKDLQLHLLMNASGQNFYLNSGFSILETVY